MSRTERRAEEAGRWRAHEFLSQHNDNERWVLTNRVVQIGHTNRFQVVDGDAIRRPLMAEPALAKT